MAKGLSRCIKAIAPLVELTLRNIMLNLVKNILWPSCQNDFMFCETQTIINKDLYVVISYDVVHNMHAKFK